MVVAVIAIMVGCHVCFVSHSCVVVSRGCVMVIAIIVSCSCGWLLQLVVISHGCIIILVVTVATIVMDAFVDVVLIVVVGCHV